MKCSTTHLIFTIPPSVLAWSALSWTKKVEGFQNPAEGTVTSSCGIRENPILHTIESHDGIDIALEEGTPVVAVKSGVVMNIRTSATYGLVLEYTTYDGYEVMYAHLSDVLVDVGDLVLQGDAVALSGNTGLSTGPHLHYGLWRNGILLDPLEYVTLPYTQEVVAEYTARGDMI